LSLLFIPAVAFASNTPQLNQTINAGTLSTDIFQSDDLTPVASPTVAFPAKNVGFTCQTATATLGDANNKINVTNLDTAGIHSGWTLTMAPALTTASWTSGSNHYDFNDSNTSGCGDGADADSYSGQLTVSATTGATITQDCNGGACTSSGSAKGADGQAFVEGTTDSATLMTDSNYNPWEGYLTGVGLSQRIPAQQTNGSYALTMTITVTAT
jgi:hypothetical protein